MRGLLLIILTVAVLSLAGLLGACGDDGDSPAESSTPVTGTPAPTGSPVDPLSPPLEGPDRGPSGADRTNFRESEEWQLPSPDAVPAVPDNERDAIFHPPSKITCPDDWVNLERITEGFSICYPTDWQTAGYGYVAEGQEDRWLSLGLVKFTSDKRDEQDAHVSVYVMSPYTRPMTYTRDCPSPYSLTFAGKPAVICPEFPGEGAEKDFVSYHIRRDDFDYFVQIVSYEGGSDDALETAIEIAHTFKLIPVQTPQTSPSPTP